MKQWKLVCLWTVLYLADGRAQGPSIASREELRIDASKVVGDISKIKMGFNFDKGSQMPESIPFSRQDLDLHGAFLRLWCKFHRGTVEENISAVDPLIQQFTALGASYYVGILGVPRELSSRPDMRKGRDTFAAYPPKDWQQWEAFVRRIVHHYNTEMNFDVSRFGIWNEPNMGNFWRDSTANMLKLYEVTATAIRKEAPHAKIGGMEIAGPLSALKDGDEPFSLSLIKYCHERKLPLDFVTFHLYRSDPWYMRGHGVMQKYRSWLRRYGFEDTEVWNSEWRDGLPERWMRRNEYRMSNHVSAVHFVASLAEYIHAGLDRQCWFYFGKDSAWAVNADKKNLRMPDLNRGGCGFLSYHGVKEASYHALEMVNRMGNALLESRMRNQHAMYAFASRRDGDIDVIMAHYPAVAGERAEWFLMQQGISEEELKQWLKPDTNAQVHGKGAGPLKEALKARSLDGVTLPEHIREAVRAFFRYADEVAAIADLPRDMMVEIRHLQPGTYILETHSLDETHGNPVNDRLNINAFLQEKYREAALPVVMAFGLTEAECDRLLASSDNEYRLKKNLKLFLQARGRLDKETSRKIDLAYWEMMREMEQAATAVNRWPSVAMQTPDILERTVGEDGVLAICYTMPPFSVKKLVLKPRERSSGS